MSAPQVSFQPGALVSARGREWIVLPQSEADTLYLRPLGATEEDATVLYLPIERQPVQPATFPWPEPSDASNHAASQLLRDALQLKLRLGAGPFRSFGNIAVEPRAYQLVPLLMALKLDVVRLLVADDVGIGKTIEAALIVRELLDRGEIRRVAVLCPPHLCEQWQQELQQRFHIHAAIVRTSTASRLERGLPAGQSIFDAYPFTVVSLDYIKADKRRAAFAEFCPECVIVDEAHTCSQSGKGKQQRYQLLKELSEDTGRHMILLTATPHSGNEEAFFNLLGLLKPEFLALKDSGHDMRSPLRQELSRYFVQRRRPDIEEWQDSQVFPRRLTAEVTYQLTGLWGRLFNDVLDYARELVEQAEGKGQRQQRMNWWAALALLRCISSSPAAAVNALRTRLVGGSLVAEQEQPLEELEREAQERVMDGVDDNLSMDDVEPAAKTEDSERLETLIANAETLLGRSNDPKLAKLVENLEEILAAGFQPVIFCRYIATAHYLAEHLKRHFRTHTTLAVTGELTPGEREAAVEALGESEHRILVATDCLSEGINLQHLFTAVVHYDLSWNPTRHEQREGRVDRFGQKAPEVRATMIYGADNPVDGAVLKVILRKAESIRKELGILVPMPDDGNKLTQALLNAVLLRKGGIGSTHQQSLDFGDPEQEIETVWQDARDKAQKNRTLFAQQRLKPEEVLPEWQKTMAILGGEEEVERFILRTSIRLGSSLEAWRGHYKLHAAHLPLAVRERLELEGLSGTLRLDFKQPPALGATYVHRTHPVVGILADYLLEKALDAQQEEDRELIARAGAIFTDAVTVRTTIVLLRLRHQLSITRKNQTRLILCEEMATLGLEGLANPALLDDQAALKLLEAIPTSNMPTPLRDRHIQQALDKLQSSKDILEQMARQRAQQLLDDHRRVREASDATGTYAVIPSLPVDVMGVFVLLPAN